MNFGPINQRGGEKRLNVIFSRAKHHMAVVSSIRHGDITNDHNDGANCLKNFLQYAEATSRGELAAGVSRSREREPGSAQISRACRSRRRRCGRTGRGPQRAGHVVDCNVGQSRFRCDLAVASKSLSEYQLGILVDTSATYQNRELARSIPAPAFNSARIWLEMRDGADKGLVSKPRWRSGRA